MKNQILILLSILSISIFTSCKKPVVEPTKNYFITETIIDGVVYNKVEGVIDEDLIMSSNINWFLSGGVFVDDGATLTIPYGQTIYADVNLTTFLSIKQGGKINANGSSNNPIIFTPLKSNPTYGDWGGIIINGRATINTGFTAEGEGGTGIYGGDEDMDNSGSIRYVRVEYAGKILGTDNELNGFSFNGVGSGTLVEYIQAYKGSDDGIEFFGGTVNVRYAVSTGNQDDCFDWTHGWSGKGQYWYAQQDLGGGDRGVEADNNGDDNSVTPFSNPTISNMTLNGVDDGDGLNEGIRLRAGTKGKIYYSIVTGFPKYGVNVTDVKTLENITNDELFVANSNVTGNGINFNNCSSFNGLIKTLNDSWFYSDSTIGSGTSWMLGWTKQ